MNQTELMMQRRQTRAFIEADASNIVLKRVTQSKTANGGFIETTIDRLPQRMRIIRAGLPQTQVTTRAEGTLINTHDQLVAMHDAEMGVGEWFEAEGRWEILEISSTEYRKVANLKLRSARG